ncbi:hypothetical protein V6N12_067146 [Hibiscus sabdariffa]|uniref:Uncharacterized protein n=1 Tax=Hibiscus sabdariffa TaxID=183260 RepID=A0ABR2BU89_9ROSI
MFKICLIRAALAKWLSNASNMIDMEAQRMQHVLEQDHDDMDDDDPNESHIDAAKPIRDLSPHSDEILVGDGGTRFIPF